MGGSATVPGLSFPGTVPTACCADDAVAFFEPLRDARPVPPSPQMPCCACCGACGALWRGEACEEQTS